MRSPITVTSLQPVCTSACRNDRRTDSHVVTMYVRYARASCAKTRPQQVGKIPIVIPKYYVRALSAFMQPNRSNRRNKRKQRRLVTKRHLWRRRLPPRVVVCLRAASRAGVSSSASRAPPGLPTYARRHCSRPPHPWVPRLPWQQRRRSPASAPERWAFNRTSISIVWFRLIWFNHTLNKTNR